MNKLAWLLLLLLSALTQNAVLASGNPQVLHSMAVAAWIWLAIVLRQQNARPLCVGAVTDGRWRGVFLPHHSAQCQQCQRVENLELCGRERRYAACGWPARSRQSRKRKLHHQLDVQYEAFIARK